MKQFDVTSICNALVDILVSAEDSDIQKLGLTKGMMHLVDEKQQATVLAYFQQKDTTTELGGSSLNAIRTLASLGLETSFAGMVGDDSYGRLIKDRMDALGIQSELSVVKEATGTCLVLVTPDGERTMNTNLGASRLYDEGLVPKKIIKKAKVFHFSGYQWDTSEQIGAIEKACLIAKNHGVKISFDVADPFVVDRHKDAFINLIGEMADVVFANTQEAKMLFDCDPESAAKKIAELGAVAVIKKGAQGAVVGGQDELHQILPIKTTVVDTTAAGDMFAAGFLYGMAKNFSWPMCGHLGAVLAGDVISRIGAAVSEEALGKVRMSVDKVS